MADFSENSMRRIIQAVQWVESQIRNRPPQRARWGGAVSPSVQPVRVTSTTPTDGRYPGKVLSHDAETDTYTDLDDIWVVGLNGAALAVGRYKARRTGGVGANDRAVFLVDDALLVGDFEFTGDLTFSGDAVVFENDVTFNGTVTGGSTPAFSGAQVTRTSMNITDNTATAVAFSDGGSEVIDEGGYFTSANNTRLTAPATGYYYLSGNASLFPQSALANATDPFYMALFFGFNGTPGTPAGVHDLKLVAQNAGILGASLHIATILPMSSGNYVELYGQTIHETGGTAINGTIFGAIFSIIFLGP